VVTFCHTKATDRECPGETPKTGKCCDWEVVGDVNIEEKIVRKLALALSI